MPRWPKSALPASGSLAGRAWTTERQRRAQVERALVVDRERQDGGRVPEQVADVVGRDREPAEARELAHQPRAVPGEALVAVGGPAPDSVGRTRRRGASSPSSQATRVGEEAAVDGVIPGGRGGRYCWGRDAGWCAAAATRGRVGGRELPVSAGEGPRLRAGRSGGRSIGAPRTGFTGEVVVPRTAGEGLSATRRRRDAVSSERRRAEGTARSCSRSGRPRQRFGDNVRPGDGADANVATLRGAMVASRADDAGAQCCRARRAARRPRSARDGEPRGLSTVARRPPGLPDVGCPGGLLGRGLASWRAVRAHGVSRQRPAASAAAGLDLASADAFDRMYGATLGGVRAGDPVAGRP